MTTAKTRAALQDELDTARLARERTMQQAISVANRLNALEYLHDKTVAQLVEAIRLLTICVGNGNMTDRDERAARVLIAVADVLPKPMSPVEAWPTRAAIEAAHWAMAGELTEETA